jgi:hypothetical protein
MIAIGLRFFAKLTFKSRGERKRNFEQSSTRLLDRYR